jgi:hypothetical protein
MNRFRQAFADFGRADRRQRTDLALAFAFEEASERAQTCECPHQGTTADIGSAPHRHERPHIAGLKRRKTGKRHALAPVFAEEVQELTEVAGVGFGRLRRQPALGAQMRKPARHFKRDGLVGAGQFEWRTSRCRLGHRLGFSTELPTLSHPGPLALVNPRRQVRIFAPIKGRPAGPAELVPLDWPKHL